MDIELEKIRGLAALMNEMGLEELYLEEKDSHIHLKKPFEPEKYTARPNAPAEASVSQVKSTPETPPEPGTVTITSPMVGVYYSAPSPEEPPFVTVGQTVRQGDVLCIIEAMKLMNEIVAEQDGVIAQCYLGNGQLVEYGQPLFRMRSADE